MTQLRIGHYNGSPISINIKYYRYFSCKTSPIKKLKLNLSNSIDYEPVVNQTLHIFKIKDKPAILNYKKHCRHVNYSSNILNSSLTVG